MDVSAYCPGGFAIAIFQLDLQGNSLIT
ncbi:BgTH12-04305 [Blumeria graminis f. sp. triticale]|uniref:BgTH12-04305 n=1 Tax=Blumeria graminis f. sp. triticale TaxID=1689686 RepID=A0A9W4DB78_BLUGR|nr:BgTH12-04305 [Blumeria graminis f. sp. triticale]